ncbi:F-box/FBD/LRR-repeat protein [Rhynchospora pubera]|uniref:F-box/FBD/LRR-repeat protein n=1 Tax=Rhynchospora pubera TaxID=906938 RepID=A0AAV8HIX2_9POAL|nr:F-box/FBD/LRR-repeat protein [Rhynchospora pubera]
MAATAGHPAATTLDPPPPYTMLSNQLSDLPELPLIKILSSLPTHMAAQTSCLSRRFRHLWSDLPSLHFIHTPKTDMTWFVNMVDRALLCRDTSVPLETLHIEFSNKCQYHMPIDSLAGWIRRAGSLGVRHLLLRLESSFAARLRCFSIESLESLHMENFHYTSQIALIPHNIVSTRLKSLKIWLNVNSADLTRLVNELPVLEYLDLSGIDQSTIDISSPSIRTLKLDSESSVSMKLCLPKLDILYLVIKATKLMIFQAEMPLLSKVKIHVRSHGELFALVLRKMLEGIANAIDLKLSILTSAMRTDLMCCEKQLCFPRLESLHFSCSMCYLKLFEWEMPVLIKADIDLSYVKEELVPPLSGFLERFANVVELKFKIAGDQAFLRCREMQLSFFRLEYLKISCSMCFLKLFQAEMPGLKKVDIHLSYAKEEFVPSLSNFMKNIANVVDLKLTIMDDQDQVKPFHMLESDKKPPLFSRLISFEVSACCHEATIEDVISLLENCPVLNCLTICHRDPNVHEIQDKRKRDWQSKLPRNSEGNFRHASFTDVHIRDERSNIIKLLSRRLSCDKRKI